MHDGQRLRGKPAPADAASFAKRDLHTTRHFGRHRETRPADCGSDGAVMVGRKKAGFAVTPGWRHSQFVELLRLFWLRLQDNDLISPHAETRLALTPILALLALPGVIFS